MKQFLILSIFLHIFFISKSQDVYEYKKEVWSKNHKKLNGKVKIHLLVKNSNFYWIDCSLSVPCFIDNSLGYSIIDSCVYFNYSADSILKKHKQFSLKGDTLDYMNESDYNNGINIEGHSIYMGDTTVNFKRLRINCFKFVIIENNKNARNSVNTVTTLLFDRQKLIPIQKVSEYFDKKDKNIVMGYRKLKFNGSKKYEKLKEKIPNLP